MLKIEEVLLQQKVEKQELLEETYVERSKLPGAIQYMGSNLIKVVTGPRRAGKSVFSLLMLADQEFAYINFDDEALLGEENHNQLFKSLINVYPNVKRILLDEVQNLEKWELFVSSLKRNGYNIVLTGSNSRLLSKELASNLTGRYIPIEILPFSFEEFLRAKKIAPSQALAEFNPYDQKLLALLNEYLFKGGFPEIVLTDIDVTNYLSATFDSILLNDIVNRYSIRNSAALSTLAQYMLSNFTKEYSYNRLKNVLHFSSEHTVKSYVGYLDEAYLLMSLPRYSPKVQEQINAPRKIYCIDNGYIDAYPIQSLEPKGKLLENLVFIQLNRLGYNPGSSLFYYRTERQNEVDFALKASKTKYGIQKLVQVSLSVDEKKILDREVDSMIAVAQDLDCQDCYVVTWDYEGEQSKNGYKVKFIPIVKFLLWQKFPD